MKFVLNGWFWPQPHTGSGQYLRALADWLPRVAPQHEFVILAPDAPSGRASTGGAHPRQRARDEDARAAPPPDPSRFSAPEPPPAVRPVRASRSNLGKVIFEQFTFPRLAAALRADAAHVPYWAPPLRSRVPTVVTVHDLIPLLFARYRGSVLVRLYTALVASATRGAAQVIAVSEASRADALLRLGLDPGRVHTIYEAAAPEYRPADSPGVEPSVREKYGLPEDYVLYLGGFDWRKNVRGLLAGWTWAAGAIGAYYPLVIAGEVPPADGRVFPDVRGYAQKLGLSDSVRFIGPVAEADKPALYRGAAAFVYPSRYEGFGLPVLEAMACGTPVITTDAGSLGEVAGDAAYLVKPDDARAIGAAIIAAVVEPQLAEQMRARGLARAAEFSWEKAARETMAVYEAAAR